MDKILIVEDDRFFREMFADFLKGEGYHVDTAACGADAFKMLAQERYGLVITDLIMPDINGMEILSTVREGDPSIDVIMVTGNANLESAIFALKHGARDYLVKPVNPDEFRHSVAQCMNQRRLLDENEELKNMLALFQSSQAIAGCLDLERVYHLVVDAIVREMGLSRGVGIFLGKDGYALKEVKGLPYPEAKALFEHFRTLLPDAIPECRSLRKLDQSFFSPVAELADRNWICEA
jgi:DNA-binding response OmpR family regulator